MLSCCYHETSLNPLMILLAAGTKLHSVTLKKPEKTGKDSSPRHLKAFSSRNSVGSKQQSDQKMTSPRGVWSPEMLSIIKNITQQGPLGTCHEQSCKHIQSLPCFVFLLRKTTRLLSMAFACILSHQRMLVVLSEQTSCGLRQNKDNWKLIYHGNLNDI